MNVIVEKVHKSFMFSPKCVEFLLVQFLHGEDLCQKKRDWLPSFYGFLWILVSMCHECEWCILP